MFLLGICDCEWFVEFPYCMLEPCKTALVCAIFEVISPSYQVGGLNLFPW